ILSIISFVLCSPAQDSLISYNLDEDIVVTASRIPTHFPSVARSVIVIDQNEIQNSNAKTIAQLLETNAGIDFQQRGDQGVQADLKIRGTTFEQSLVLVDGVKISDPQTGHHMMDIPITLNDIQKIEILKGQGSRLYGPNAFGGVINIITKNASTTEISILNMLGENKFFERNFSVLLAMRNSRHRLSIAQKTSDGYRDNTDFEIKTASYGFNYSMGSQQLSLFSGLMDKQFGANSFYHPAFPNQWERTQTTFFKTGLSGKIISAEYTSNLFYRYHTDEFMLNRNNPAFYHNQHYTHVYGADIHLTKYSRLGNTSIGSEFIRESIESNNLGSHQQNKYGLFMEHQLSIQKAMLTLGSTVYHYAKQDWQIWPGLEMSYQITDQSNVYGSFGLAFRTPTFTELYYNDPANRGNKNLNPEKGKNYEIGWRYINNIIKTDITVFRREGRNLIDWIWLTSDSIWQVTNITRINTNGFEFDVKYPDVFSSSLFGINSVNLSYTYLDSEKEQLDLISKYVINHLRHKAVLGLHYYIYSKSIVFNTMFRFEDRIQFGKRYLLDSNLTWQISKYFKFHLDVSNLLNHNYEDFHSIPLPRRWIKSGISFNINKGTIR
ncbi:MAG TPA: TonB-dependent receptor, partial [Caldithrix sp.]|nr:TonB-dependent receptor [Caldithrix sp.]